MSDCKHTQRMKTGILTHCLDCESYFTRFELETLERAEQAEARVKELEADLAKSHDDGYAMGWREALEIAQEKIMRIER